MSGVTFDPFMLNELVVLLRPKHPSKCLPHDLLQIVADWAKDERVVKFIRLLTAGFYRVIENTFIQDAGILSGR